LCGSQCADSPTRASAVLNVSSLLPDPHPIGGAQKHVDLSQRRNQFHPALRSMLTVCYPKMSVRRGTLPRHGTVTRQIDENHHAPRACRACYLPHGAGRQISRSFNRSHQPYWNRPMFVRAVWRIKRLVDIKQTLREMDVPSTRDADLLGISGPDFSKMTRSLFDR